MSLLDTVEPDGFARYAETYPTNERHFVKFSKTTDGWADRLCEPLYSRETVESLLSQCRKEALLEGAERDVEFLAEIQQRLKDGRYKRDPTQLDMAATMIADWLDELRRMAESDKTTMEGEK